MGFEPTETRPSVT